MRSTTVYLDGRDLERDCEPAMRFRLTYEGPLLSSKPPQCPGDRDRRIEHKHDIRRRFHQQLKALWEGNRSLRELRYPPKSLLPVLPDRAKDVWEAHPRAAENLTLPEILGPTFGHDGYEYVPLVWREREMVCSLRILLLRRDGPEAVGPGRDIDNRIKTLIDALVMPSFRQGQPRRNGQPLPPQTGETPFFVLMDDDRQVDHLEVETDTAHEFDPANPPNEDYVRLVVTVEFRALFQGR